MSPSHVSIRWNTTHAKSHITITITILLKKQSAKSKQVGQKAVNSCVGTACPKLSTSMAEQLVDINRLVARLFQQVRYSRDITILLVRTTL